MRHTTCDGASRRDFLKVGSAGLLGLGLSDLLRAQAKADAPPRRVDSVIQIWLAGGPATIDMWDLKPGAPTGGEFRPRQTSVPGLEICEHLPMMAQEMKNLA